MNAVLLWVSTVCQVAFVGLWFTMPWHKSWVGRALMVKSFGLGLFLVFALVKHYSRPEHAPADPWATALFAFITLGIVSQLCAILYEVCRHRDTF